MLDDIFKAITNPIALFRKLEDDDRVASRAFVVVLIIAILGAVYGYFSALPSADAMKNTGFGGSFSLVIAPISAFIASFIFWLIYGLIVRMAAGMEAKPWAVVAYSYAPQILIFAVLIMVAALFPPKLTSITASLSDPEAFQGATLELQREFQSSLLGRVGTLLTYVASLWSLVLTFLGVRETVGQQKAVRATIILGLITSAFFVVPFLLSPVG
jgi:hypothetical protein